MIHEFRFKSKTLCVKEGVVMYPQPPHLPTPRECSLSFLQGRGKLRRGSSQEFKRLDQGPRYWVTSIKWDGRGADGLLC